jgi:hypothetical protein
MGQMTGAVTAALLLLDAGITRVSLAVAGLTTLLTGVSLLQRARHRVHVAD